MIYAQIDPGANISCAPHLDLLTGFVPLQSLLPINGADARSASMISYSAGWFAVYFHNSTNPINTYMHNCKDLAITIISPQHACDHDHSPFDGWGILAQHSQQAFLQFHLQYSIDTVTAPLITQHNLYFVTQKSVKSVTPTSATVHSVLAAELWHQCLGHPGLT
jgi:hypothetical protein